MIGAARRNARKLDIGNQTDEHACRTTAALLPPNSPVLSIVLALHASVHAPFVIPQDSARTRQTIVRDSSATDSTTRRRPTRLPVTAEVLATAFLNETARELFTRAKVARITQDSSMQSYDAKVRQRISVRAGIGKAGPERLAYRGETAARVQWQRNVGARIQVTGTRMVLPILGVPKVEKDAIQDIADDNEMIPIPYFPGSETLWIGGGMARAEVDDNGIVNPLATGAEAYYTYQTGDSVQLRLPDGKVVRLRELAVRPRTPKGNLAVGSLWFDVATGQLVRAAYRLAAATPNAMSAVPNDSATRSAKIAAFMVNSLFAPNVGEISSIAIEYGLYQGKFWLPRLQSAEGSIRALFARVPVKYENSFTYASVNASPPLGVIQVDTSKMAADSSKNQCRDSATRVVTQYKSDARIPSVLTIPCNDSTLIYSKDFVGSIYDDDDAIFDRESRDQLIGAALGMRAQAAFSLANLPRPRVQIGPSMMRYNRVEGFSTGVLLEQQLGGGFAATAIARYGFSDGKPNGEFAMARTNLSRTVGLNVYSRLNAANDWGAPLSFGSSLSALLYGRDEGFYFRSSGVELQWNSTRFLRLDWRAYTEHQSRAVQNATFTVGGAFVPNIAAHRGRFTGLTTRWLKSSGNDPRGLRTFTDVRLEGAIGDSAFARRAVDFTMSHALPRKLSASLALSTGSSVGDMPIQRHWFLGGLQTIRGQNADTTQHGNAFWMTRAELSAGPSVFRSSLFGDFGWTGDRSSISRAGRPLSGVGLGFAAFDGLVRFDVSRGIHPRKKTRVDFYLNRRL